MKSTLHCLLLALLFSVGNFAEAQTAAPILKTKNVFLIISDGLRWQEVFTGAEEKLMTKSNGVKYASALRKDFWRDTDEERRKALLPFFWSEIAQHGQIYGNQTKGSIATVTNGKKFSYPGYNEMLTGSPDERIDSNKKIPNPNVTVFEWLQTRPGFQKRVAAFGSWDVFPYIFNRERSGLPIWPAWEPRFEDKSITPSQPLSDMLRDTTALWSDLIFDSFLQRATLDYVAGKKPHALFIGFGETDEWAHENRYDLYLQSAQHVDSYLRALWDTVQSLPEYKDQTTFIITADHGRGSGETEWRDHGSRVVGAENIWLAVLGPDTPALGERTQTAPITQSQIAATLAALLGEDYRAAYPKAGAPIADILGTAALRAQRRAPRGNAAE